MNYRFFLLDAAIAAISATWLVVLLTGKIWASLPTFLLVLFGLVAIHFSIQASKEK